MKNVRTFASALVVLLGTSTLAFAENTVGFDMNGAASTASVGTRAVSQTGGTGNNIDATINGSINTISFTQIGSNNDTSLTLGGSSSGTSSYGMTAIGDSNVVATALSAAATVLTYALDILGSSNEVTETFTSATTKVDADTSIIGSSNISEMLVDALSIVSDYIVLGSANELTIDADAGDLDSFTSYIDVLGSTNNIHNVVNAGVTTVDNNLEVNGSTNDIDLIQSAATSKINATINASSLNIPLYRNNRQCQTNSETDIISVKNYFASRMPHDPASLREAS